MMKLDVDNSSSVQSFVNKITADWFDIDSTYHTLKSNPHTNLSDFFYHSYYMMDVISNSLGCSPRDFLKTWEKKCLKHNAMLMGYHCTRHSNERVFINKGILPLSEKLIETSSVQKNIDAKETWERRLTNSPGPFFCLSYEEAKKPDNYFCRSGAEILSRVDGLQPTNNPAESVPLIIHCAIPFSIIPNKEFCTFCIVRAYLFFLDPDPEDGSENLFEGYSIDLCGVSLKPQHILRIEKISTYA
jgi:hypothetical protein